MDKLKAFLIEVGLGGWLLLAAVTVWSFSAFSGYKLPAPGDIEEFRALNARCWVEPCRTADSQSSLWMRRIAEVYHVTRMKGLDEGALSASFSPDGRRIVSISTEGTLQEWDVERGEPISTPLRGHESRVLSASFSPDGRRIVSISTEGTLQEWDVERGEPISTPLRGHESWVLSVAFSPDGRRIASGGDDGMVRQWDARTGLETREPLKSHEGRVLSVAFSPDGRRIASGGDDGMVRQWDARTGLETRVPLKSHEGWVLSVAFSPDGRRIASGGDDGMVRQWDARTGLETREPLKSHEGRVLSVAFSPDGRRIASGGDDGMVRQWLGNDLQREPRYPSHGGRVLGVSFIEQGSRLVSANDDGTVRLFDLRTDQQETLLEDKLLLGVVSVSFSPSGRSFVSVDDDGMVLHWDTVNGQVETVLLKSPLGRALDIAFSPDGRRMVSGGDDGTVRQWDAESSEAIGDPLTGHEGPVLSVALSPDGKRIISGGDDGTVRQWDAESSEAIGDPLTGHEGPVLSVAFSPNGKRIVSGGDDATVRQWDAESSEAIGDPLTGHVAPVLSVWFGDDRGRLVSFSEHGGVLFWNTGSVTPPLLTWLLFFAALIELLFFVWTILVAWDAVKEQRLNAPGLVSDRPIADPAQATTAMREVVTRLAHFLRNPNTSAPLTFAVIGQWGSGKSTLMKLAQQDLRKDHCPCVWFNAWHHQNEAHLFAALMEAIRLNSVPRSPREIGRVLEFRINLILQRIWNAPFTVTLFLAFVVIVAICAIFVSQQVLPDSFSWSRYFVTSIAVLWAGTSRWNPVKTFGVTPASLARASAAWIQIPRFLDRLSFREKFGRAFGEVCQAFGSRRLVIIIDDLDRCRPEQVVEILEAVNFLTSNGDCFVLLGIDESQVEHAVGLHYRDIAEETGRQATKRQQGQEGDEEIGKTGAAGRASETKKYEARLFYARQYLKKLINLRIKVPSVNQEDLFDLRGAILRTEFRPPCQ